MILDFFHFFDEFLQANRIAPDGTPHFAASHLGLFYLPMSHKRDDRLKRVKQKKMGTTCFRHFPASYEANGYV